MNRCRRIGVPLVQHLPAQTAGQARRTVLPSSPCSSGLFWVNSDFVTVLEVIQRSTDFLTKKGVESPRLQVELLLAHALKTQRLKLYLDFERTLVDADLDLVREMVKRRGNREPLQHILGSVSFCGLEMNVTPDVLIPRPETEILAEKGCEFLSQLSNSNARAASFLDLGAGSGCLAITLAVKCPNAEGHAVDLSVAALAVAQENAAHHQVSNRLQFYQGETFDALPRGVCVDLIVSNPPYIPTAEIETLAPEVRDHDPRMALDGGPDGLHFFRLIGERAGPFLQTNGKLMFEIGDGQSDAAARIMTEHGWAVERIESDLTGRPRILIAHRMES